MKYFIEDVNIFYLTLYGGIVIGILFDFYRVLRRNYKVVRRISIVFDIVFWFLITIVIFTSINLLEGFNLRYYHFIALFLGFILYYNTISKYILIFFNKTISFITSLFKKTVHYIVGFLNNLYYIIIYSIHLIFDIICYIPSILLSKEKEKGCRYMKIKMLKKFIGQYIIVGLFVFFLVFSIITGFIFQINKIIEYKNQIAQINNQIEDTKDEISKLKKISKDDDLEDVARDKLGMIKSNEIIYLDSSERGN